MDIGQPKDYLIGQTLHLASLSTNEPAQLSKGDNIKGNVMVHESAIIDPTACVGPNVVVGADCKIGAGAKVSNTTLMAGSTVGNFSYIDGSIIGWKSSIG